MKKLTLEIVRKELGKKNAEIFEQVLDGRPHLLMTQTNIDCLYRNGFDVVLANNIDLISLNGCYKTIRSKNSWYFKNGEVHRLDGPAIEYADGDKRWFIEGIELNEKVFDKVVSTLDRLKIIEPMACHRDKTFYESNLQQD